ncbi:MAG TPA: hypothetical protein VKY26_03235, partial [Actinomycetota bacterium]|nr:hypothetical protein [Actinomycetota bacterium]
MGRFLRPRRLEAAAAGLLLLGTALAILISAPGGAQTQPCPAVSGLTEDAWTGAGGDGMWFTGKNWATGVVPAGSDLACIPSSVATAITISSATGANATVGGIED